MTCGERQDSLLEYALGTLEGPELENLRVHLLSGCPVCEGKLAEAHAMLAMLSLALPPVKPSGNVKNRLLSQIATSETHAASSASPASMRIAPSSGARRTWWIPALLGAAAAACVTILIYSNLLSESRRAVLALRDQLSSNEVELTAMRRTTKENDEMIHLIEQPSVKIVVMQGGEKQPGAKARLIYDPASRTFCLCVYNMKPLPAGKGYEFWMFGNSPAPMPAGTFLVDDKGDHMMQLTLPADPGKVIQVAISEEPYNDGKGLPSPTMSGVQFVQKIQ